jgi:hypothetical protein
MAESANWGIMAEFPDPAATLHAAEKVREAGYKKWDVYAPFPIHGIEVAMGMKHSKVSNIVASMAVMGLSTAIFLTMWTSAAGQEMLRSLGAGWLVDILPQALQGYPMRIGGKPYDAWEQFMPIFFELSVLFSAFGAIGGMILLSGLPKPYHPLLKKPRFLRVSDDRFVIAIESADPQYDVAKARQFLSELGGSEIEEVPA